VIFGKNIFRRVGPTILPIWPGSTKKNPLSTRKLYEDMLTDVGSYKVMFEGTLILVGARKEWGDRALTMERRQEQNKNQG
jgi:hypothetical protein